MTTTETTTYQVGQLAKAIDISPHDVLECSQRSGCNLWWIEGILGPQDWWFTKRYAAAAMQRCMVEDITFDLSAEQRDAFARDFEMTDEERAAAGL